MNDLDETTMTMNDWMREVGEAAMRGRLVSLPLTADQLRRYLLGWLDQERLSMLDFAKNADTKRDKGRREYAAHTIERLQEKVRNMVFRDPADNLLVPLRSAQR